MSLAGTEEHRNSVTHSSRPEGACDSQGESQTWTHRRGRGGRGNAGLCHLISPTQPGETHWTGFRVLNFAFRVRSVRLSGTAGRGAASAAALAHRSGSRPRSGVTRRRAASPGGWRASRPRLLLSVKVRRRLLGSSPARTAAGFSVLPLPGSSELAGSAVSPCYAAHKTASSLRETRRQLVDVTDRPRDGRERGERDLRTRTGLLCVPAHGPWLKSTLRQFLTLSRPQFSHLYTEIITLM